MKNWLKSNRGFITFLLLFGLFRGAVADWNPIPSGSMRPTLLEGDVVLVNRVAYDVKVPFSNTILAHVSDPQRGDVVTFDSPSDGTRLIKRIVGLPGDHIEMHNERVFVNGQPLDYVAPDHEAEALVPGRWVETVRLTERLGARAHRMQVMPALRARRDVGPLVVPQGQYYMLGDNRDNSADSRYFGFVPRALLIGRAHHVLVSADILGHWQLRPQRFAEPII